MQLNTLVRTYTYMYLHVHNYVNVHIGHVDMYIRTYMYMYMWTFTYTYSTEARKSLLLYYRQHKIPYQFHALFVKWHSSDTQPITSTDTVPYFDNDPISETQYGLINFN